MESMQIDLASTKPAIPRADVVCYRLIAARDEIFTGIERSALWSDKDQKAYIGALSMKLAADLERIPEPRKAYDNLGSTLLNEVNILNAQAGLEPSPFTEPRTYAHAAEAMAMNNALQVCHSLDDISAADLDLAQGGAQLMDVFLSYSLIPVLKLEPAQTYQLS